MSINRLSLIMGIVIVIFAISLSSCESEPYVSRTQTVEIFNSSIDVVKAVEENHGYDFGCDYHYANTSYKYVLFDGNVYCPVDTKSGNPEFKTESNNLNGPIHKNDICIDCGYKWRDHEEW